MNSIKLSIVIPFRASKERPYLLQRLESLFDFSKVSKNVEYILVDSGSDDDIQHRIKTISQAANFKYYYQETQNQTFSIGSARDFGVQRAKGKIITFLDVDLIPTPGFEQHIIELALRKGLFDSTNDFFVLPCLYLNQIGTADFLTLAAHQRHKIYYQQYLNGDDTHIQNLAPCSSVMVINRHHYLSLGGHRPEFKGHGYEDFELLHRLLAIQDIYPRPRNYYKDTKSWDMTTYEGFRAYFSLLGREALAEGLFTVHMWHPRPPTMDYENRTQSNHINATYFFKKFDNDGLNPYPLLDLNYPTNGKVLFFGTPFSMSSECIRQAMPYLGQYIFMSEDEYTNDNGAFDNNKFIAFIHYQDIQLILFPNPYGNSVRHSIYQWVKNNDFPYYCFDRGALPDSWFFDPKGFNADSSSYSRDLWDKKLSSDNETSTQQYIDDLLSNDNPLEAQGNKVGADALMRSLKTGGKKVLFVPFQRPSDTVIKHFSDIAISVENFTVIIDHIAKELAPYGWVVLCKKHPLENEYFTLENATWVPDDTHFIDLMELSDAVALINSGVGIYAAILGKPCYIFGNAFYNHPDINTKIKDVNEATQLIIKGSEVSKTTTQRLIYHLVNRVYSFGVSQTKSLTENDGSQRTLTTRINFYKLNIPNRLRLHFNKYNRKRISIHAPLFERYLNDIKNRGEAKQLIAKRPTKLGQELGIFVFRILARPLMTKNQAKKLERSPQAFFRDSKNGFTIKYGKIIYG